jgi:UDP-perosamine 4-acetyltransferase
MQSPNKQLLVIGGGGHAKVVIDVARSAGWNPVAALDPIGTGHHCAEVPVVGDDDMAEQLFGEGLRLAVVAIGSNRLRVRLGDRLHALGFQCPAIVHPGAIISPYASVGDGSVVMPGAIINSYAQIGRFAIVNTGAIVEHDCRVGNGAHVAPRSVMGGNVDIGELVLFGIGAVARPETTIERGAIVGAGSVVVSRIEAGQTVVGAPARRKCGSPS